MSSPKRQPYRRQQPRRATSQIFRRASLDQLNFEQPLPQSPGRTRGSPQRPVSAWSRPEYSAQLPNIKESASEKESSKRIRDRLFARSNSISKTYSRPPTPLPLTPKSPQPQPVCRPSFSSSDQVPIRKSSIARISKNGNANSTAYAVDSRAIPPPLPPPLGSGKTIPQRGTAISPVRFLSQNNGNVTAREQRADLRTFKRTTVPMDIVEVPELKESRFSLALTLAAPVFTGGGTVEGHISMVIEGGKSKTRPSLFSSSSTSPIIFLKRLTIDVLGVERFNEKKNVFQSLAMELIDHNHPPPLAVLSYANHVSYGWRLVAPSTTKLPFCLSLPISVGPPPYKSKIAGIHYTVSVTALLTIGTRSCCVRTSRDVDILTVNDPETTLGNIIPPLAASDTVQYHNRAKSCELRLMAGIHRQTWVSGSPLYVDVLISNKTDKDVKRIDLSLEKVTSLYEEFTISQENQGFQHTPTVLKTLKEVVVQRRTKAGSRLIRHGWPGTPAQSQDESTCMLEVPIGLVTVDSGRLFSVQYLLTVQIKHSGKRVSIQIPVTLIHPNSLDIVPNSLAQVAKAIASARRTSTSKEAYNNENTHRVKKGQLDQKNSTSLTPYLARQLSIHQTSTENADPTRKMIKSPKHCFFPDSRNNPNAHFAPLTLDLFEEQISQDRLSLSPPTIFQHSKIQTPVKEVNDSASKTADIKALTKELHGSPQFKQRASLCGNETEKELQGSIMERPRPWARSASCEDYTISTEVTVARPYSPEVVRDNILQNSSSSGPSRTFDDWSEFRPRHKFHYKINDLSWSSCGQGKSKTGSPRHDGEWEDLGHEETNSLGGGPGPDVGRGSHSGRLSVPQSCDHQAAGSSSSSQRRHRISYLPSNHGRTNRREFGHIDSLKSPRSKELKRQGGIYELYHRRKSPVPKYYLRRSSGNARSNIGRMQIRNFSNNPFFHGSGRLVTSRMARDRSFTETGPVGRKSQIQRRSRGRSFSENLHRPLDHTKDRETLQHQVYAEKLLNSTPTGRKPIQSDSANRGGNLPMSIERFQNISDEIENSGGNPKPGLVRSQQLESPFETPKAVIPEIEPTSSNYSQPPSKSSSTSSLREIPLPPAAEFGARIQQWRLQNPTYDPKLHLKSQFSEATDYADYLASPPFEHPLSLPRRSPPSEHSSQSQSTIIHSGRHARPEFKRLPMSHLHGTSPSPPQGTRVPTPMLPRDRPILLSKPIETPFQTARSLLTSSGSNPTSANSKLPRASPHQHYPSTSTTSTSKSATVSSASSSRPPPSHPNSNILSPIAEASVVTVTPKGRSAPMQPLGLRGTGSRPHPDRTGMEINFLISRDRASAVTSLLPVDRREDADEMSVNKRVSPVAKERRPGERRVGLESKGSDDSRRKKNERKRVRRMEWLESLGFEDGA